MTDGRWSFFKKDFYSKEIKADNNGQFIQIFCLDFLSFLNSIKNGSKSIFTEGNLGEMYDLWGKALENGHCLYKITEVAMEAYVEKDVCYIYIQGRFDKPQCPSHIVKHMYAQGFDIQLDIPVGEMSNFVKNASYVALFEQELSQKRNRTQS